MSDTNKMTTPTPITIHLATPLDIPHLPLLESSSDQIFRTLNMSEIADSDPSPIEIYLDSQSKGHIWVASSIESSQQTHHVPPIAFIQIDVHKNSNNGIPRDGVFIHQISVNPAYARQGIGKRLFGHVEQWAGINGFRVLELTTFEEVPWNRKYYERLGFRVMSKEELGGEDAMYVKERLERERKDELLGRWKRVAMRKFLWTK